MQAGFLGKIALAALLGAAVNPAASASAVEITVAASSPPTHFLIQNVFEPWTKEVARRSNGEITFQWSYGGTLFTFEQNPDAVKDGLAGMAEFGGFWLSNKTWPVISVFGLPFLFDSTVQANFTLLQAIDEIPELKAELAPFKVLGAHNSDFNNFHMARGVAAPSEIADFEGKRLIPAGGVSAEVLKLLGAIPRDVAFADRNLTVERGEVDGQITATAALAANKVDEVSDSHAIVQMLSNPIPGIMNLDLFNSLSAEARQAIDEMKPSWTRFAGCVVDNRRAVILAALKKRGDNVEIWDQAHRQTMIDKIQPIYDNWIKQMDDRGLDGAAILAKVREIAARNTTGHDCAPDPWWPADAFLPVE